MMWSRARLEMSGPLAPRGAAFTKWLGHKGYAPTVVQIHRRRMIHLIHWMQALGIDTAEFGPATVGAFVSAQSAVGRLPDWKAGWWAALLDYLRSIGVQLAEPPAPVVTATDALLTRYAEYEATERVLGPWSIERNVRATLCGVPYA
jgi:hypothetical protein